ncbi:hypothetical protein [Aeromicrobium duanguangcaii]|uniref:WXG100 family type VII secretion target n=1 Tax=Aeromicrobium duanguangcaii TaxID=2968086 RepID=A0ABY5KE54_9ACTN|nr:hypothetical protein [Aeromicrobium duanguangcaii]MCD9154180.1 hypothetical protein [Aeromicrobium duanguangcaii]MCL3837916.1 hypothetical protein [Aeromicrobium duanguangcaii]UUI68749.1 hypothetical protein NP095_01165 [Aeromicrobium duanguangcaii]
MTVELDHEKLTLAATRAEALASRIRTNAAAARQASPVHLPSLDGIEKKADWLEEQVKVLTGLADTALLLDESGQVDLPLEEVGAVLEEVLGSYLTAKFNSNYGLGDNTDFPWIEVGMGLYNLRGISQGVAPVFQTGFVGQRLLQQMRNGGPFSSRIADFMVSGGGRHQGLPKSLLAPPARVGGKIPLPTGGWADPLAKGVPRGGLALMRGAGVLGGGLATVNGGVNLYQQGRPDKAFKRGGAGYVADVAETAFSASSTAFLIAPNPATGAAAVGSGLVWAGAEVVDNWDDITEKTSAISKKASKAWDKVTPW